MSLVLEIVSSMKASTLRNKPESKKGLDLAPLPTCATNNLSSFSSLLDLKAVYHGEIKGIMDFHSSGNYNLSSLVNNIRLEHRVFPDIKVSSINS